MRALDVTEEILSSRGLQIPDSTWWLRWNGFKKNQTPWCYVLILGPNDLYICPFFKRTGGINLGRPWQTDNCCREGKNQIIAKVSATAVISKRSLTWHNILFFPHWPWNEFIVLMEVLGEKYFWNPFFIEGFNQWHTRSPKSAIRMPPLINDFLWYQVLFSNTDIIQTPQDSDVWNV